MCTAAPVLKHPARAFIKRPPRSLEVFVVCRCGKDSARMAKARCNNEDGTRYNESGF